MALFEKKKRVIEVGGQKIELEPKPSKSPLSFLGKKKAQQQPQQQRRQPPPSAPQQPSQETNKIDADYGRKQESKAPMFKRGMFSKKTGTPAPRQPFQLNVKKPESTRLEFPEALAGPAREAEKGAQPGAKGRPGPLYKFLTKQIAKQKGLAAALKQQGIRTDVYSFAKRMFFASIALCVILGIAAFVILNSVGLDTEESLLLGFVMALAIFQTAFRTFMQYPFSKEKNTSKNTERDILFAARDLIISLRSGMPLFNAITSVSSGYGDASKEFAKIVDRVQLGMPLEEAIDDTVADSKSQSFKRIMLQASVSIKAGADVVGALQSIIDQLSQERIIELRSYGQKLNAIAMFYMLFGVILPSMGIAVITILTTFIALFTVDVTVFEFVLVAIIALQIIFLKLITASRPVFST
jgi:archaeal flagellar protein FlaJ